ncbi:MAG: hypothetical protein EHM39_07035, partial [Chloroflexi bacterium]
AVITNAGIVSITAEETSKLAARAAGFTFGSESKVGAGAAFAVIYAGNLVNAYIGKNVHVTATQLTLTANKHRVNLTDFSLPFDFDTHKFPDGFDFFTGLQLLNLLTSNNYYVEAIAGSVTGGDVALAGAFAVLVFNNVTAAFIDENAVVNVTGNVSLTSTANVNAKAIGGAVAATTGKAGVGITMVNIVNWDVIRAFIAKSASVTSSSDVSLRADADQEFTIIAVSAAGGDKAGVGGAFTVLFSKNASEAYIGEGATVNALGSILLNATNDTRAFIIAGGGAGASTAAVNAVLAALVIWNDTNAYIGTNAVTNAMNATSLTASASELGILAVISLAGSGTTSVGGAVAVKTIKSNTQAYIGQGAHVNLDLSYASPDQTVSISATDTTTLAGIAGNGAVSSGSAGLGASSDTTVLVKIVNAYIGASAQVRAVKAINILAKTVDTVVSITAGFAGASTAAVGGSVGILIVTNTIQAYIGDNAVVFTNGNIVIEALSDLVAVVLAGSGGYGGSAGVGGSLGVTTIISTVLAYIGQGANVTALGNVEAVNTFTGASGKAKELARGLFLTAYSTEVIVVTVVSGQGGGSAGVAVSVGANVIRNITEAFIKANAVINQNNAAAHAAQEVRLVAVDETVLTTVVGMLGAGGSAGVGAASDTGDMVKTTRAYIQDGASVNAKNDIMLSS